MGSWEVEAYLSYLATEGKVSASTQRQALNAFVFIYREVLGIELGGIAPIRSSRGRKPPPVLAKEEVRAVLGEGLLYGCGLRLFECLNLRVGCINFGEGILTIHDGKGKNERTLPLPQLLVPELERHMKRVENLHKMDLKSGYDGVFMPGALDRKWKNPSKD